MSREVSPELSAYIVSLLEARRAEFKSQNKMAAVIGIPGGSLSAVMGTGKRKGVGVDILEKLETFLGKTRAELEQEAGIGFSSASTRVYIPARQEARVDRLSEVRKALLKKYSKAEVDGAIGESEFLDGLSCSELEAYQRLEGIILLGRAASKGKMIVSKAQPDGGGTEDDDNSTSFTEPALKHLESVKKSIAERPTTAAAKRTRK